MKTEKNRDHVQLKLETTTGGWPHHLERRAFLQGVGAGLAAIACGSESELSREPIGTESEALCAAWPPAGVIQDAMLAPYLVGGAEGPFASFHAYLIPDGLTVTICTNVSVGMLIIEGTLIFDPGSTVTLTSYGNVIVRGKGLLQMRPANGDVKHTLQFSGINESKFKGGDIVNLPLSPDDTNVRDDVGLWVTDHGVLDLQGTPRGDGTTNSQTWTRSTTYDPNYPNWLKNDTVIRAPVTDSTDPKYLAFTFGMWPVAPGSPPKATTYDRSGSPVDYYAEVFNLTRNVVICGFGEGHIDVDPMTAAAGWADPLPHGIAGGTASYTSNQRAHVMFVDCKGPTAQNVRYVRLEHLGPRMSDPTGTNPTAPVPSRYPLHFHMCGDALDCLTVEGVVAVLCGNHSFVPHKTNGIAFHDCISYYCFETAYWWDPPSDSDNMGSDRITYDHCAALAVQCDPSYRGYDTYGFSLGQASTNMYLNRCTDCVVVASMGTKTGGGFTWPAIANLKPNSWVMDGCVSHNNVAVGVYVWQNDSQDHFITRFASYHNGSVALLHGAYVNKYTYDGLQLFGAGGGAYVAAQTYDTASPPNNVQFTNSVFDGAGVAAAFVIGVHTADGTNGNPALIKDSTFRGAPHGSAVYVAETDNGGTQPGFFDFLNVTVVDANGTAELATTDFANLTTGAAARSVFRIEHANGESWQYTATRGWESLPPHAVSTGHLVRAVPPTPPSANTCSASPIPNSGFDVDTNGDSIPDGWTPGGAGTFSLVSSPIGGTAVKLDVTGGNNAYMDSSAGVLATAPPSGANLVITISALTTGSLNLADVELNAYSTTNGTGAAVAGYTLSVLGQSGNFATFSTTQPIPTTARSVRARIRARGTGSVTFDDLRLSVQG